MMATRTGSLRTPGLTAALVGVLMVGTVARASDLGFSLNPQSAQGLIKFAGGSSVLDGEDIGVDAVTGLNTPLNGPNTRLPVTGGDLSFQTGKFLGGNAAGTQWDFGSGGVLNLKGAVPSLGIPANSDLLTGQFSDPTFVRSLNGGDLKVQGGAFFSIVNEKLASYFGLPTGVVLYSGGLTTLFRAAGTPPNSFTSSGFTGGTLTVTPVPEPGSVLVFGALAAGAFAWTRRRWARG